MALIVLLCALALVSAQSGADLTSVDFGGMIGGPLVAAIKAQAQSAAATAAFINAVGFDATGKAISVAFSYDSVNQTTGEIKVNTINVPLLVMLPIPYLEVELVEISFNARVSTMSVSNSNSFAVGSAAYSGSDAVAGNGYSASTALSASFANVATAAGSNTAQAEFSLSVLVRAKQAELPDGTKKLLDTLMNSIFTAA